MTVQSFNVPSSSGRTLVSHTGKGGFNSPRDGQYAGVAHGDAIGFKHREGFGPDGSTPYARTSLRTYPNRQRERFEMPSSVSSNLTVRTNTGLWSNR